MDDLTPQAGYVRFPVDMSPDADLLDEQLPPQYRGLVGFEVEPGTARTVFNPWLDVQGAGPVHPRDYYGFKVEQTGGGYTAWTLVQDGVEYMLTNEEGEATHVPSEGWVFQAHPVDNRTDGNPHWLLHIGPDQTGFVHLPESHGLYLMEADGGDETFAKASGIAQAIEDAILNELTNDSWGHFYMPDGSRMIFEISVRAKNPEPSPEIEGAYPPCPKCGQGTRFYGIDDRCGAKQRFDIDEDGEPDHMLFEPFDIGSYTSIECVDCGTPIWEEYLS